METIYREELTLTCDKSEFRTWLEHQYPLHAKYYKDTPSGATFSINLTVIQISYSFEVGQHKFIFEITEPEGHSKIREEFIATVRNTFQTPQPGRFEKPHEPPKPPEPKKNGGKVALWLEWYDQMNENGFKCTLGEVAQKSGYVEGYLKQLHARFKSEPKPETN